MGGWHVFFLSFFCDLGFCQALGESAQCTVHSGSLRDELFCYAKCGIRRVAVRCCGTELLTALHFLSFPGKKGNEAKERNRRQGKIRRHSGAPPLSLKCLRHLFTELLLQDAFLPLKAARRVGAPRCFALVEIVGAEPANFAQAGLLARCLTGKSKK